MFKLGHECVIIFHKNTWIQLLIHASISLCYRQQSCKAVGRAEFIMVSQYMAPQVDWLWHYLIICVSLFLCHSWIRTIWSEVIYHHRIISTNHGTHSVAKTDLDRSFCNYLGYLFLQRLAEPSSRLGHGWIIIIISRQKRDAVTHHSVTSTTIWFNHQCHLPWKNECDYLCMP